MPCLCSSAKGTCRRPPYLAAAAACEKGQAVPLAGKRRSQDPSTLTLRGLGFGVFSSSSLPDPNHGCRFPGLVHNAPLTPSCLYCSWVTRGGWFIISGQQQPGGSSCLSIMGRDRAASSSRYKEGVRDELCKDTDQGQGQLLCKTKEQHIGFA